MSGTYVTTTGFIKKTLEEIVIELEADYREQFGDNIDLDSESPFGQQIGIQAKSLSDGWDGLGEIYTARNPQEATGTSLDFIVSENNIIRQDAQPTTVLNVKLFGDEGTVVLVDSQIRAENIPDYVYELDTAVTITKTALREIQFEVDSPSGAGELYRVTIDSVNYDYTTLVSDTEAEVIDGLIAQIIAGSWAGTASNIDDTYLKLEDITDDFSADATLKTTIFLLASGGNFTGLTAGAISAPSNTLQFIVTPITGWDDVNNPADGVIGQEVETDEELRIRRSLITAEGYATDEAIRTGLIQNVTNVSGAAVTSNRTLVTDSESRPAKSFEAIVSGGTDQDVADEIWNRMPAGIESYGNETVNVTDSQGQTQVVNFSRPVSIYIWVIVSRDYYDEESYPADGDTAIKQAIVDWAVSPNIDIGVDVIRQRLATPVYTVSGIGDILIEIAATATPGGTPTYAEANIDIDPRETADFDLTRITVQDLTP